MVGGSLVEIGIEIEMVLEHEILDVYRLSIGYSVLPEHPYFEPMQDVILIICILAIRNSKVIYDQHRTSNTCPAIALSLSKGRRRIQRRMWNHFCNVSPRAALMLL